MEELQLTQPKTATKYRVIALTLHMEMEVIVDDPGQVIIELKDNLDQPSTYSYTGATAVEMIKWLNTANLTTKSMQKRILERLSTDGYLPGTVVGTPDPPA